MPRSMPAPDHDPARSACLVTTTGAPVPLVGVDLRGEVFGAHARMVLRQRYRNDEKKPIEAIYTFPVPSDAALVGFTMECQGRRLEAEIKPREEAFAAYDEAISAGHGAALLDEERRNVFTASVGNLLPGEETTIEVVYVQALRADEGALRLVVPTVVAPRYVPAGAPVDRTGHGAVDPNDRVPDADRISPSAGDVAYGLSIDVLFDLGRPVTIESPSHGVVVKEEGDDRWRVTFGGGEARLDKDLVLVASGEGRLVAGVTADRRAGQRGTFALTVVPDLFDPNQRAAARDVVFVVDTSGSMGGASIEEARAALRLCLRQLGEGDRFEILAFSSQVTAFHGGLVPFNQATLARADSFVSGLVADGGTEMLQPLMRSLDLLADRSRDRVIVMLTDGQVANEAEIVERVAARAEGARVYTFGIGVAVSDLLVTDLARRTCGAAEMIHPGERIDDKVTAQFARAIAARVTSVSLTFEDVEVDDLAPAETPDLVDGEPWVIAGRYAKGGRGRAKIRGRSGSTSFYLEVPLDLPEEATRDGLAELWARAKIRDLEEAKLKGRRAVANEKRITELSVEHRVASRFASFVVVERRSGDRLATGQPAARPIPVEVPADMRARRLAPPGFAAMGGAPVSASAPMPMRMAAPRPQGAASSGAPPAARAMAAPITGAPSASDGAAKGGGIGQTFARAKRALFGEPHSASAPVAAAAAEGTGGGAPEAGGLGALFGSQLASGLFGTDGDDDDALLMSTARVLARAFSQGVDAAHPIYGAQIKKTIEAVIASATAAVGEADKSRGATAALLAAHLVATSKRQKERLLALVRGGSFPAIEPLLVGPADAARLKLAELTG